MKSIQAVILLSVALVGAALALSAAQTQAQNTGLSVENAAILEALNRSRIRDNLVQLVPSPILNQAAEFYINDLAARPINALGDVFLTTNRLNIDDLLAQFGYTPYPNGFVVDFVPIVIRDFGPTQIVDFWISDFARSQAERTILSRRMVREGEPLLPFFSPLYREVGIASAFSETTGRYYYTIIFAAQPNVLPVVVTDGLNINRLAQSVTQPEVLLYIHNERAFLRGDVNTIGAVRVIRVSEQEQSQTCPANLTASAQLPPGWERYTNEVPYTLQGAFGLKTIYVQMCDENGRTITMSAQVEYGQAAGVTPLPFGGTPTPDVLDIANATQTAAASATSYAPYLATVEAILTATASAEP